MLRSLILGLLLSYAFLQTAYGAFPAEALVRLENATSRIGDLRIGDQVFLNNESASAVYFFWDKFSRATFDFLRIEYYFEEESGGNATVPPQFSTTVAPPPGNETTPVPVPGNATTPAPSNGTSGNNTAASFLRISPNHYLYVNGKLALASTIKEGDVLIAHNGSAAHVRSVSNYTDIGLFSPFTWDHELFVDDIKVTSYTKIVDPYVSYYILWPIRLLYVLGYSVEGLDVYESDDSSGEQSQAASALKALRL